MFHPGQSITDKQAMAHAIELAWGGRGRVSPNPLVGCVIVDAQGNYLSSGYHKKFGDHHAEVEALNDVERPELLKGARVFVTLEPCAHQGKTPSCAHKLASLPIAEVIFGLKDPHKEAQGGEATLNHGGIKTSRFDEEFFPSLNEVTEIFLHNVKNQRAFVTLKVASSLDGKIAILPSGESQWITNQESRIKSHELRATYDSVLVGAKTLALDQPRLTVRLKGYEEAQPKVIIVSATANPGLLLKESGILDHHDEKNIFWLHPEDIQPSGLPEGIQKLACPLGDRGGLDILALSQVLYEAEIYSVMVEGGARVFSSFLNQKDSFQRLHLFMAPKLIGKKGLPWTKGYSIDSLEQGMSFDDCRWTVCDGDVYFTGRPK